MTPKAAYTEWKRKQIDVGCQFAKLIATQPDRYGQSLHVIGASSSPGRIAASVAKSVGELIDNPNVSAAALLLPNVTSLEQFARGVWALGKHDGWAVDKKSLIHPTEGKLVAICVSRIIPATPGAFLPSEILAFGPFDLFPRTRKAPIPAIELFVGVPMALDPKTKQPPTKVNLAHLDVNLPTHRAFEKMWDNSVKGRTRSLDGVDDPRAKAKVSLVVSEEIASSLTVEP